MHPSNKYVSWPGSSSLILSRCAECLGLLGAIDPARINVLMLLPDDLCDPRGPLQLLQDVVNKCVSGKRPGNSVLILFSNATI